VESLDNWNLVVEKLGNLEGNCYEGQEKLDNLRVGRVVPQLGQNSAEIVHGQVIVVAAIVDDFGIPRKRSFGIPQPLVACIVAVGIEPVVPDFPILAQRIDVAV
jgi:hypothetical protein